MNVYNRLGISFIYDGIEYELYPIDVDDYDDTIEIITYFRHPNIKRGCVGDLDLRSGKGFEVGTASDASDQIDTYENVLLKNILIWSNNEGEAVEYKYTFLKD
jgi:hypothetical protein